MRVIQQQMMIVLIPILIALGTTAPASAAGPLAPYNQPEFMRGVVSASFILDDYTSADSDAILQNTVQPMGANWISLVVTCFQDTVQSTAIFCLPYSNATGNLFKYYTPTDVSLAHSIATAHKLGLKVALKPGVDLLNDPAHWRGQIGFGTNDAAWKAWFASYTMMISRYAAFARDQGADAFVMGTELVNTNRPTACDPAAAQRADDWRQVAAKVRSFYPGKVYYAANWGSDSCGEDVNVQWWDAMDAIGVDAYFPITTMPDPTVPQLVAAWQPWVLRLEGISAQFHQPVLLPEIGYQSRAGANTTHPLEPPVLDLAEQANCYEAFFQAFQGRPWLIGVFWWAIPATLNPDYAGGPTDTNFTPRGKPAADVLRKYYTG